MASRRRRPPITGRQAGYILSPSAIGARRKEAAGGAASKAKSDSSKKSSSAPNPNKSTFVG
eukprot:1183054-Prorocentrum_minimum.AAC.1